MLQNAERLSPSFLTDLVHAYVVSELLKIEQSGGKIESKGPHLADELEVAIFHFCCVREQGSADS
jgi:hypothetical protein